MRKNGYIYIITILLSILLVQCLFSMKQKSPVSDEVSHHIATGYSFLKTGDFRLNSTSPPLTEELAALPFLFLKPVLPLEHKSWGNIDRVTFGYQFLFRYNDNADQLVFWSRISMVVLSLLCAVLVFIFARDLYGVKAGLFATFLYVFSPNILAYSRLVTPDIGATFLMLFAIYRFYKFLRKPKIKNVLLSGVALGLAEATKYSALLLLPLFLVFSLYRAIAVKKLRYVKGILVMFAVCYALVFASYLGEVKPLLENDVDVEEKVAYIEKGVDKVFPGGNQAVKDRVIDFAQNTPIPFAAYIMNILAEVNMVFVNDYGAFLMGERSNSGWWYYYPVAFFFKTPIPTLILMILAAFFFARVRAPDVWAEAIGLFFMAGFIAASLTSKLQLSVRYLLPMYPLIFIYISKVVNVRMKRQAVFNLAIGALSLWYVLGTIGIYPDYLAYFNRFAGGPDGGWRYLRDANIDYGQDLPALAKYMKKDGIEKVKLSYFGSADPKYYGIDFKEISDLEYTQPEKAVYALSVNNIDKFSWAEKENPVSKAGYSIFIYDFREKE